LFVVWLTPLLAIAGCQDSIDDSPDIGEQTFFVTSPPADKVFGCNGAGQAMESFGGVTAYCNDSAESGEWQCDQFANRVMSSLGYPPVDNWVNDIACEICDIVNDDPDLSSHYSVWGPGYRATAGHEPGKNDLLIWYEPSSGCNLNNRSKPGHVAVVTGSDANYVHYIQQNWIVSQSINGSSYASVAESSTAWNASSSFFSNAGGAGGASFAARCWIHPEHSLGTGHNPCINVSHANNGLYCGASTQAGFLGHSVNSNTDSATMYECIDGQVAREDPCELGCVVAPAGVADHCVNNDPCAAVSSANNGVYCGTSTQAGFASNHAVPTELYTCHNSLTQSTQSCANGCVVAPAGQADHCR
jgi:hypothetical protein